AFKRKDFTMPSFQVRSLLFSGAVALVFTACSGGSSSTTIPNGPSTAKNTLDIKRLFAASPSGRTVNAIEPAVAKRLAAPSTNGKKLVALQANQFTQTTTTTYTSTQASCLDVGAAYNPLAGAIETVPQVFIGIYDPASGDLKLNVSGLGTVTTTTSNPVINPGGKASSKACYADTDLVPPLTLKAGTTYTVFEYQPVDTALFNKGNAGDQSKPEGSAGTVPGSPNVANSTGLDDEFEYAGLAYQIVGTPLKNIPAEAFSVTYYGDAAYLPIGTANGVYDSSYAGSPRIEFVLTNSGSIADNQPEIRAFLDGSTCKGANAPTTANAPILLSATNTTCKIVGSDGTPIGTYADLQAKYPNAIIYENSQLQIDVQGQNPIRTFHATKVRLGL
ncbi:MAG: hypothetical protein M3N13_08235, partial [Candidatus Eremiobacteraeota bacterium]|nr:hypothetical protein [Candidatus Eremiobacteraeota bacterium]